MRIIRASDCKTTPWKNGGGSTTEIAIGPSGASLEDFDWRISMAVVASDGPFSDFAGIDRTLAVVKGSGLVLSVGGSAPVTLSTETDPVSFAGGTPTSARLTAGEITDLNVMTRRRRFRHRLQRVTTPTSYDVDVDEIVVVLSLGGATTVTQGSDSVTLDSRDAVLIERPAAAVQISPTTGRCYLISLSPRRSSHQVGWA